MTFKDQTTRDIVFNVIRAQDYRHIIVNVINEAFLETAIDFFKKVVIAKLNSKTITIDWYKEAFLNSTLSPDEIATNAGLNKKTILNIYKTGRKSVVIDASNKHLDHLYESIKALTQDDENIDLTLTIKFKGISVDLNVSESLIVINTLAAKRVALRGGAWSAAGKKAEKYIMLALCRLYQVPEQYYSAKQFVKDKSKAVDREVDFYFINHDGDKYRCEVKLMGKGNPESADAIIARDSSLFVADTLSEQNKRQCDQLGVCWVLLKENEGYKRIRQAFDKFRIPYTDYNGNLDKDLPLILDKLFQ